MEQIQQRYFSVKQLAAYTGLNAQTIYNWVEAGKIKARKVGRVWRIDKEHFDQYMKGDV